MALITPFIYPPTPFRLGFRTQWLFAESIFPINYLCGKIKELPRASRAALRERSRKLYIALKERITSEHE
jgi:hypothetical protein